jgi:GNAT superfamily N-acetyltransferase
MSHLPWQKHEDRSPPIKFQSSARSSGGLVGLRKADRKLSRRVLARLPAAVLIGSFEMSVIIDWVHRTQVADGRAVLIRRASQGDEQFIQRFMQSLSALSRYQRFFYPLRDLTQSMMKSMVQPDETRGTALLAFGGGRHVEMVGMAQYDVVEPGQAEVAVIVDEGWRRVGLATQLLSDLEIIAAGANIVEARADILRENPAALTLAQQVGCLVDTSPREPYTLHVIKRVTLPLKHPFQQSLRRRH